MFRTKTAAFKTIRCPGCGASSGEWLLKELLYVCPACGHHLTMPAPDRIAALVDPGTFRELDEELVSVDPLNFMDFESYQERLRRARKETGMREAVMTGFCRVGSERAVLVIFDFRFLGGTMGSVVGEKVASAFEEATKHRISLVSVTATGGARVQEGMLSLMQMAKVAAAVSRHNSEGLGFISAPHQSPFAPNDYKLYKFEACVLPNFRCNKITNSSMFAFSLP